MGDTGCVVQGLAPVADVRGRLLVIARELRAGGAAYLIVRHLQRLPAGLTVDLLITGPVDPVLQDALPGAVTLQRLPDGTGLDAADGLSLRMALRKLAHSCLEQPYDAVIGSSLFPDITACTAFCLAQGGRKLVVLLDEGLLAAGLDARTAAAQRAALLAADHLLPVSRALLDKLARHQPLLPGIPATVLPPPIDPPPPQGHPSPFGHAPPAALPRLVTVARLSAEKQLERCLTVQHRLRQAGFDCHWHVIGEGPERRALERRIARLGMGDRFHLEGFRGDARAWIHHGDLFVLASRSEGCPTVIREAIAEGTPVLATDVCGVRELLTAGGSGAVIADTAEALESALVRLLGDRRSLRALRLQARSQAARSDAAAESATLLQRLQGPPRPRPAPRVSILIPTYNQEATIAAAIDSALMQDFPELEVVVCDDASTDATVAVARRFAHDRRLRIRSFPHNRGRVANYRHALEQDARGDWVLMLDGDDHLVDPGFVTTAMAALADHARDRPVFVQAGHRVIWEPLARRRHGPTAVDLLPAIHSPCELMDGERYLRFVYATGFFTHLGTLYSRAAALRQGFYSRDISSADMDSLLRLALGGRVLVLRSIAGCWRQHGANASARVPLACIADNVRIFRQIAREGAAAGVLSLDRLERDLSRYEARTLATLFGTTIGLTAHHPGDAIAMLRIIVAVNPRLLLRPDLLIAWGRALGRLIRLSWGRFWQRGWTVLAQGRDRLRARLPQWLP